MNTFPAYRIILVGADDTEEEIDFYTSLTFNGALNGGSTAKLDIALSVENEGKVNSNTLATRKAWLKVYRQQSESEEERLVWYGNLLKPIFSGDESKMSVSLTYEDIFSLLRYRRTEQDYDEQVSTELSDLAWDVIDATQIKTGGDLGIIRGADPTTVTRTPGTEFADRSIKDVIETLSSTENGFDFEITPTPKIGTPNIFNVYYEGADATYHKGSVQSSPLTYIKSSTAVNIDNNIKSLSHEHEGEQFITFLRMQGATVEDTAILSEVTESVSLGQYGLFEDSKTNNDISNINDLDAYAAEELRSRSIIPSQLSVELLNDTAPAFGTFDVGDIFNVNIQYYNIYSYQGQLRLYEWSVTVRNEIETVTLSLNTI